jgi:hypothetical protein
MPPAGLGPPGRAIERHARGAEATWYTRTCLVEQTVIWTRMVVVRGGGWLVPEDWVCGLGCPPLLLPHHPLPPDRWNLNRGCTRFHTYSLRQGTNSALPTGTSRTSSGSGSRSRLAVVDSRLIAVQLSGRAKKTRAKQTRAGQEAPLRRCAIVPTNHARLMSGPRSSPHAMTVRRHRRHHAAALVLDSTRYHTSSQ